MKLLDILKQITTGIPIHPIDKEEGKQDVVEYSLIVSLDKHQRLVYRLRGDPIKRSIQFQRYELDRTERERLLDDYFRDDVSREKSLLDTIIRDFHKERDYPYRER